MRFIFIVLSVTFPIRVIEKEEQLAGVAEVSCTTASTLTTFNRSFLHARDKSTAHTKDATLYHNSVS